MSIERLKDARHRRENRATPKDMDAVWKSVKQDADAIAAGEYEPEKARLIASMVRLKIKAVELALRYQRQLEGEAGTKARANQRAAHTGKQLKEMRRMLRRALEAL